MTADSPYEKLHRFLPDTDELGIDGYRVLRPVGEGGFGRVFQATQLAFDRDVAIKVISASGFQDETARRFERECRAVGALSTHPNIVTIYDSGISQWGRPYIVMEHMTGGSLAHRLTTAGPLEIEQAVDVIVKVAGAVETAHRAGILHRDIKPENLLLSEYREPKLADFGIASIPGGYQTHTGAITASLAHAAPEVLEGAKATARVDIYALGSTLFTLIAGRSAFGSSSEGGLQALIARIVTEPVPDLRSQGVPDEICTVIETAMAKDPSTRYATAEQFATALNAAQDALGFPVTEMMLADASRAAAEIAGTPEPDAATLVRPRRPLSPPAVAPLRRRARWRSPVTAAVVVAMLSLGAGGTLALKTRRPLPSAATEPAGVVPTADADASIADASADASDDKKRRSQTRRRAKRSKPKQGGAISFGEFASAAGLETRARSTGAGGTSSGPTGSYAASGGGSGSGSTGTTSGGTSGGSGSGSGGATEPKPAPPEPARLILYHFYSEDGSYYFTSSQSEYNTKVFEYDDAHNEAAVWATGKSGMRRLCFGDGRCGGWVYIEKPAGIQTRPLYNFIGPHGDYYTTNKAEIPPQYADRTVHLFGWVQ